MTDADQITLYSCHLCGFCETSLSALTKHTASHIKTEQRPDHYRMRGTASGRLDMHKDGGSMTKTSEQAVEDNGQRVLLGTNGSEVIYVSGQPKDPIFTHRSEMASERHQGAIYRDPGRCYASSERDGEDDEIIVLHDRQGSPQVADVFPSSSGTATTQSRVIFPSGWGEPTSRTTTIRMPTDRHRNIHQTESSSAHESREHGQGMPKIINCTTVRPRSQQRGYVMSNGIAYSKDGYETSVRNEQPGYATPTFETVPMESDISNELSFHREPSNSARSNSYQRQQSRSSYASSNPSPVIQDVFTRPSSCRSRETHVRTQAHNSRPMTALEAPNSHPLTSPHSAFVPFNVPGNHQVRHHHPSYQDMRTSRPNHQPHSHNMQGMPHQASMHVPHHASPDPTSRQNMTRFNCPVPIPNNGTVVMNPSQPILLPPYGSHDGLAGVLVIPLKKTCEVEVQTDESCLSADYVAYQPPQRTVAEPQQTSGSDSTFLKCTICQKEFPDAQKLKAHYETSHSRDSLRCRDCGQVFLTARNMQMHKVRVHNKRMPFRCGVCGLRFEDRNTVVQHITTHNANEKIFRCDKCGKRFGSEEKLWKHEEKHKDMFHKCSQCNKNFGSEVTLGYHIEQVHKRPQQNGAAAKGNEAQSNAAGVEQEQLVDSDIDSDYEPEAIQDGNEEEFEELSCQFCQSKFVSEKELETHVRSCEHRSFGQGSTKMFRCAACHTFFATKSQLVSHYNTKHLTRDGYMCSKCPRKFRLWSRLKLHLKAFHRNKRPMAKKYTCTACSERFMSRNKLEDHLRTVHQIQPFQSKVGRIYTCKECKKRFTNLSSLMVHRRGVHSLNILESPSTQTWKCQYCSIERLTKKTYIAHLKEVHSLVVVEKGRSLEIVGNNDENTSVLLPEMGSGSLSSPSTSQVFFEGPVKPRRNSEGKKRAPATLNCNECDAFFADEKRLKNHLGLVHGQEPFECDVCSKKFAYSGQLSWHMREHSEQRGGERRSSGGEAPASMIGYTEDGVTDVNTSTELQESGGVYTAEQATPFYTCIHCNTTYQDEKRLNNHLGMRHGYKNFACDVCDQKFSYSTHLIWHRRSHFADKKAESETRIGEVANPNEQRGDGDSNLGDDSENELGVQFAGSGHPAGVSNEYRSEQQTIDVGPSMAGNYPQHTRFVCAQCGAEFNEQEGFRNHMISFHDARIERNEADANMIRVEPSQGPEMSENGTYVCEVCNKQLATQIGWKVHRTRVHKLTEEKTAVISSNQQGGLLPMAVNQALNDSNNPTPKAGKKSSQAPKKNELGSEDLSPSAVYSCSKCSRVFTGLRSLRTHQFKLHAIRVKDTHHRGLQPDSEGNFFSRVQGGQLFQCGTCDYQFSTEKGRRIHCKKMRHVEHRGGFVQVPTSDGGPLSPSTQLPPPNIGIENEVDVVGQDVMSPSHKRPKLADDAENVISPCEICEIEFPSFRELKLHFQEKHPEEVTFQTSPMPSAQGDILPSMNPATSIGCSRCDRAFPSRKGVNAHLIKFHKLKGAALSRALQEGRALQENRVAEQIRVGYQEVTEEGNAPADGPSAGGDSLPVVAPPNSSPIKGSKDFKVCSVCQRAFQNRRGLIMHLVRYHHMNRARIHKFNRGANIEDVLNEAEDVDNKKSMVDGRLSTSLREFCPLCSMRFPSKRSLGTHIFKRHGIRCKQLSPAERRSLFSTKRFTPQQATTEPLRVPKEPLVTTDCPICGGKFIGKRGLRAHVSRIHGLDKVELGFMFPERNQTDDETEKTCKDCLRVFHNERIFAAHMYFVHRNGEGEIDKTADDQSKDTAMELNDGGKEAEERTVNNDTAKEVDAEKTAEQGDAEGELVIDVEASAEIGQGQQQANAGKYRCTDPKCDQVFTTPLQLLVHVREENGRKIDDIDLQVKNMNHDVTAAEEEGDYDYDADMVDEVEDEDALLETEPDVDAIDPDSMDEDENFPDFPAGLAGEKIVCFICKNEFDDEKSFKVHYGRAHGKMSADDAERLRDMIKRSLLQTEAVSKEYSLRATASRKAFRSEIEFTDHILSKSPSLEDGSPEEDSWSEEAFAVSDDQQNNRKPAQSSSFQPITSQEAKRIVEINESVDENSHNNRKQARSSSFQPITSQEAKRIVDSNQSMATVASDGLNNQEGRESTENTPPAGDCTSQGDEPSRKSAFAAALDLKVMT